MQRKYNGFRSSCVHNVAFPRFSAAVAMSAVYDYEPRIREDPLVKLVDEYCKASFPALIPEKAVLLKAFPFCWSFILNLKCF